MEKHTWTKEIIEKAIAENKRPEGMHPSYWYTIRKKLGVVVKRELKYSPEEIQKALAENKRPEGMTRSYWSAIKRGKLGKSYTSVTCSKSDENKTVSETKEKSVKVVKSEKEIKLEARRAKYAANKDEINARRRANRAAKKAAAKKEK